MKAIKSWRNYRWVTWKHIHELKFEVGIGSLISALRGGGLLVASFCGGWLLQRPFPFICSSCKEREKATQNSLFLFKVLVPTSLSLVSALQVFQKCTIKEVGGKNLVEPTPRIEPQIKELRPGALLPLKEKKVKYSPSHSCPTNYFPFTISYSLIPTTPVLLLWLKKTL